MAESIDQLQIDINAQANRANKVIDTLCSKIDRLAVSMNHLDGSKLGVLANGVQRLGTAMKSMNNVKTADFTRLANNLSNLNKLDVSNISKLSASVNNIGTAFKSLSGVPESVKNITKLTDSISRLSSANVKGLENVDFSKIGNSINLLANSLSNSPKIQQSIISMTNAVGNLAKSGDKIPLVSSSLGSLGAALNKFISDMSNSANISDSTINFANAIGVLAKSGNTMPTTISNLSALGVELKKLMKELSTAPKVSQNLIDMTNALAKLARTGSSSGKAANSLASSFNRISKASSGMKVGLLSAVNGISAIRRSILSAMGVAGGFYAVFQGIKESINIASDLTEVQNVVDVTFGDFKDKIESLSDVSITELGMSELTTKQIASRFQAMGTAMGIAQGNMADMSVELTRLTGDMASFYNVEQKAVGEDLEAIFTGQTEPLRQYGLDLTEATLQEWAMKQGIDANINSMSQMEKTMLRYQYVMANTKAAQNDFQRTQDTWANQVRILRENFKALASVIGSSFISALKPLVKALNSAMSHIIAFAKVISNSLGKIFGWKYEDTSGGLASDYADAAESAGNLAGGTGKAADNAKKLKQQLQGFHELNVLTSPTDSGSGGSGGGGGGAGGAAGADANGGQWVKTDSILKSYESQLDTLYKLGSHIGDTLTNAMNSIDWDSIYEGARNFGSGLASFLNGLISPELFGALGKTIAASLNTALYALNSFGTTFDWNDFGVSIGTGINNFFSTFDFKATAETINAWANGLLTSLITAISTVDWSQIGKSIGEFINSIDVGDLLLNLIELALSILKALGDAMKSLITQNPLAGGIVAVLLGIKFTNKLDMLASNILNALGTSINNSKNSAIVGTALGNIFSKISSSGVGTLLGDFSLLGAATAGEIAGAIAIALPAALTAAFAGFSFGQWLYDNTDLGKLSDNLVTLILPDVKTESGDTTRKDIIMQEYHKWHGQSGISELDVQTYLTDLGDAYDYATSMGMAASEAIAYAHISAMDSFSNMVNSEEKVAREYELYGATYNKVKTKMVSASKTSAKKISKNAIQEVMAYKEGKTSIESLSTSAKKNLSNISNYVKEYLDFKQGKISFTGLSSGAKQAFSAIDEYIMRNKISTQELARQYKTSYSSMSNSVNTSINNANNALSLGGDKMISTAQAKSSEVKKAYITGFNGMPSDIASKMNDVNTTFSNSLDKSKTTASTKSTEVRNAVISGFNGMPSDIASKMNDVNTTFSNSLDKSKTTASTKSTEVRNAVISGFNGMPSNVAEKMNDVRSKIASQNWSSLGTNLTAGLGNGINNSWKGNILNKVVELAKNLTSKLKSVFNIHSPSRLWRDEIGVQLTKGLGIGIEDSAKYALEAVSNLSKNINGALKTDLFEGREFRLVKNYDIGQSLNYNALGMATNPQPMQTSNIGNIDFSTMNNQLAYTASAIAKVADRLDSNSSQPIIVNLDGREVFNSTRRYANDYYNRTGRPAFNM